ncbi:MAG: hypothetical protein AAF085_03460, partial [Planctomycetota bacterium]
MLRQGNGSSEASPSQATRLRHSQPNCDKADKQSVKIITKNTIAIVLFAVLAAQANAQILQGQWVDASQAAIEKHRKTDVTVIVLDRNDQAVQRANVRVVLERHDFEVGLTLSNNRMPPKQFRGLPVYRCFNAVALDRWSNGNEAKFNSLRVAKSSIRFRKFIRG